MKPCAFAYHTPATTADAVALLAGEENARVLAGGQSLVPMMNFRYVLPDALIDINGVSELTGIEVGAEAITIGAATRQRDLEFSPDIRRLVPIMAEAIPNIGHRQTRNRGTIGGSLAHADPAAELAMLAHALDATIEAQSVRGTRTLAITDFALGYMMTALEPDEMLARVCLKLWPERHGYAFLEFARRRGDFAIVAVAALVDLDDQGAVRRASLTVAGAGPVPQRLKEAETAMMGERATEALIRDIAGRARTVEATDDIHATAAYRQHLAGVLTARALSIAVRRAGENRHGR